MAPSRLRGQTASYTSNPTARFAASIERFVVVDVSTDLQDLDRLCHAHKRADPGRLLAVHLIIEGESEPYDETRLCSWESILGCQIGCKYISIHGARVVFIASGSHVRPTLQVWVAMILSQY